MSLISDAIADLLQAGTTSDEFGLELATGLSEATEQAGLDADDALDFVREAAGALDMLLAGLEEDADA